MEEALRGKELSEYWSALEPFLRKHGIAYTKGDAGVALVDNGRIRYYLDNLMVQDVRFLQRQPLVEQINVIERVFLGRDGTAYLPAIQGNPGYALFLLYVVLVQSAGDTVQQCIYEELWGLLYDHVGYEMPAPHLPPRSARQEPRPRQPCAKLRRW